MRMVVLLFAALGLASAAHAETLTIATFNAEFLTRPKVHLKFGLPFNLTGTDRTTWNQAGFRDQKFAEAAAAVAQVVAGIDADVVALTEVGNATDVAELNAAIGAIGVNYPHSAVCSCTDTTTRQHVAVLSKFPIGQPLQAIPGREGYYKELDDPETEADTGLSKGMQVQIMAHGKTFHLYVIHLSSERGGHEQDAQRIAQASIVRRHSLELINQGAHVIVAGDLNDRRGQPALRRIRGLDDMWPDLIQTGGVKFFATNALDTRWTYTFQGVRNQLDHVLVSRSIKDASRSITASTVAHDNALASDHRPLVVVLDLR